MQTKSPNLRIIGANIRRIRESKNLKQDHVGRKVNRCVSCISRLENGQRDISNTTLLKIAACLDVHPQILFETE